MNGTFRQKIKSLTGYIANLKKNIHYFTRRNILTLGFGRFLMQFLSWSCRLKLFKKRKIDFFCVMRMLSHGLDGRGIKGPDHLFRCTTEITVTVAIMSFSSEPSISSQEDSTTSENELCYSGRSWDQQNHLAKLLLQTIGLLVPQRQNVATLESRVRFVHCPGWRSTSPWTPRISRTPREQLHRGRHSRDCLSASSGESCSSWAMTSAKDPHVLFLPGVRPRRFQHGFLSSRLLHSPGDLRRRSSRTFQGGDSNRVAFSWRYGDGEGGLPVCAGEAIGEWFKLFSLIFL